MGSVFSCCLSIQRSTSSRAPLISEPTSSNLESEPLSKSARQTYGAQNFEQHDLTSSVSLLAPADMKAIALPNLDKTFQDQAKRNDDLLNDFKLLKDKLESFKSFFVEETDGIPELTKCIPVLVGRCGGSKLEIERTKNCITVEYRREEILRNCTVDYERVLTPLDLFNDMNKLVKRILDRAPQIKTSLDMLLKDATEMKKDIMKSELKGAEGPEAMKACIANITKLNKLSSDVNTIKKHTDIIFKEFVAAAKGFFTEEDNE